MVREEFDSFLIEMAAFYERKQQPAQKTFDLWFAKVQAIPAESLKWITKKIQDEYEIWPRNITATLWAFYHQWLDAHPEKRAIETFFNCSDCDEGLITAYKKKNDIKYRYVFRCSKCRQDKTKAYPIGSRMELMNDGYEIMPKVS